MPSISETTTIAAPLEKVWPLLSDPARVAACIPGAQLAEDNSDGLWRGSIRVKFGPTVAAFRGEAKLDYDHATHRCTIDGKGIDGRGASRARAGGVVTASASGGDTLLKVDGEFSVTGPLETFANAGGVHVARALLSEFASNMATMVTDNAAPAEIAAPATAPMNSEPPQSSLPAARPPAPAAEISALSLLWRALLGWLSGLFARR